MSNWQRELNLLPEWEQVNDATLPASERAPLHGWAPGGYLKRCQSCDDLFQGSKRSITCSDCAYAVEDDINKNVRVTWAW